MCAVFGLIDYSNRFSAKQRSKIMSTLAKECEERGTDATGFAYNNNKRLAIYKKPLPAHKIRITLPDEANIIHGHTRMATQGRQEKNFNNHPFYGEISNLQFALAHNGILYNDEILRNKLNLPKTHIETDSYIAVQLLEQTTKLDFESIADMAEQISGSFVFTVLDCYNNSYFVKGDNPLALYHFKKLGFYIYASTDSLLLRALFKIGIRSSDYTEIESECGDIIKIDANGKLEKSRFNDNGLFDYYGYCMPRHRHKNESTAIQQIKEYAECIGIVPDEIDLLIDFGYSTDEIEELLYEPKALEMVLADAMEFYFDDCYKRDI